MEKVKRKRKKESGSTYRKKKLKRDEENSKLSGYMSKFLCRQSQIQASNTEGETESAESGESELSDSETEENSPNAQPQQCSSNTEQNIETNETEKIEVSDSEIATSSDNEPIISTQQQIVPNERDPHTWPAVLTSSFRENIVQLGLPTITKGEI